MAGIGGKHITVLTSRASRSVESIGGEKKECGKSGEGHHDELNARINNDGRMKVEAVIAMDGRGNLLCNRRWDPRVPRRSPDCRSSRVNRRILTYGSC
jgi:phosphoribosyl 1,2-cyclic phosphodiesterase